MPSLIEQLEPENTIFLVKYIDNKNDLCTLCRCSTGLRDIFEPVLYSKIEIPLFHFNLHIPLVQKICRSRPVANYVQHLTLGWHHSCPNHGDSWDKTDDETVWPVYQHRVRGVDNIIDSDLTEKMLKKICETEGERSRWQMHLRAGCDEAWMALLLSRVSNIQTLTLHTNQARLLQRILVKAGQRQRPFNTRVPFESLHTVRLDGSYQSSAIDSDLLLPFFYFPAVSVVKASSILECPLIKQTPYNDFAGRTNPACRVSEIEIMDGFGCDEGLYKLISVCQKLSKFTFRAGALRDYYLKDMFIAKAFRHSLLLARDTLTSLHLSFAPSYKSSREMHRGSISNIVRDDLPFGSFRQFHVLERLYIRHRNLVNFGTGDYNGHLPLVQMLPRSLRWLTINDIEPGALKGLLFILVDLNFTIISIEEDADTGELSLGLEIHH
ncbi:hypothetical protein BDV25DRAFT_135969 [Aspergillus avenaceus]|uniref:Leucine-rich repeat domain-containing protein n=1 Tax=Aspergillus avenaceus TaxID=36643 RepID=A0A5N6U796_ASPAV|nr:hypothetical protein BDV25DRAFT_135969 [Aspergillus avenaceus]